MLLLKLGLLSAGSLYAAVVSAMFFLQRDLQYFPTNRDPRPEALGLAGVERVELTTADGEKVVLWFAPPAQGQPVVLYLHGNAGEIADRADRMALYQDRGFGAAFLSWRGYGGSTGRPTEAGLMADAETALTHLQGRGFALDRIALVGESLGTGVAVQLAARHRVAAVVLEAPYTAAVDVAAQAYPWIPVRLLMKDQFRSRAHIGQVTSPLLILHGERDRVIPFEMGRALFDQADEPKSFVSLGPVGHEALFEPATWTKGADFIARIVQR
jgi:pimeloyl-ACP methyl ester carboxylesterase